MTQFETMPGGGVATAQQQAVVGAPPVLDLPTDFTRAAPLTPAGERVLATLPPELSARVHALARTRAAEVHEVLFAALHVVLHRYSGQRDLVVGVAKSLDAPREVGADRVSPPVTVRARLEGDPSFVELLDQVREGMRQAFDAAVPLSARVTRPVRLEPSPTAMPRVVLAMHDARSRAAAATATEHPVWIDGTDVRFDLTIVAEDTADGIELALWYRTALFRVERMERLLAHVATVLGTATSDPSRRLSMFVLVSEAERADLLMWNATDVDEGPPSTVVALFEAQAARVPDRIAVVAQRPTNAHAGAVETISLTYAELNARANRLARHLQHSGGVAGAPVGLLLERQADAIVAMLGILKAEGAYMALAADAPPARLAQQLAESGAKIVITSAGLAGRLPGSATVVPLDSDATTLRAYADGDLAVSARPRDTAYVLFTSGSTGVPKGVAVTHANVVHYTRAIRRRLRTAADEPSTGRARSYATVGSLDADLGNTSVFAALLSGATLHLLGPDWTPDAFARYVASHPLDVVKLAPSQLRRLAEGRTGERLARILPRETLVLGGEALDFELARAVLEAGPCRLVNHYGPTETTVGVLTHEVTARSLAVGERLGAATVPLGRPLTNTHAYVVDAFGHEAPAGVAGELWLGGAGVASGYLNRPALSAERFVSFRGERVYRTGDRVRRLDDGTLEFLGRMDDQVKVNGYRVELGEIEQALRAHPSVSDAAVVLQAGRGTAPALVAYAVPKRVPREPSQDALGAEKLTQWLAAQLPVHMIPRRVVLLDALPRAASGKVDRTTLGAANVQG
ncbi:MAG TPA: amino acid adenylation domain-containing protein [Gemmatimonadaceae bacterium]|nr:amino acid adenylation domain-containing protein [Gemmatimonadaceae bacterium]